MRGWLGSSQAGAPQVIARASTRSSGWGSAVRSAPSFSSWQQAPLVLNAPAPYTLPNLLASQVTSSAHLSSLAQGQPPKGGGAPAAAAKVGGRPFITGDTVEYFSQTHGDWIAAKITAINLNGTYDLDCKPGVPPEKVRHAILKPAGTGALDVYGVGDGVEYYSATQGRWIDAKVLVHRPDGSYDLDCKPAVPADKIRRRPASGEGADKSSYAEGDAVEYESASHGWIPAKVLKANGDGAYNLDCKPGVPGSKIRRQAALAEGDGRSGHGEGDSVEYQSASHGWIPAKVLKANGDGTYNLDCKPDVPISKIRRQGAAVSFAEGAGKSGHAEWSNVEYQSATHGWIPAKVLMENGDGTYNLDCKPDVPLNKIRRQGSAASLGTAASLAEGAGRSGPAVGDSVEYQSANHGWIPAKVLKVNSDGTYNLDCKPDVLSSKIRRLGSAFSFAEGAGKSGHAEGDSVEYQSANHGWIPAKVLKANSDGTYNLDCKPEVPSSKIRRAGSQEPLRAAGHGIYSVGDEVEYFGATQGRWISAKVTKANADGTYDLDCKPCVPAARLRRPPSSADGGYGLGDFVDYMSGVASAWIPATIRGMSGLDGKQEASPMDRARSRAGAGRWPAPTLKEPVQLLRPVRSERGACGFEVSREGAALLEQFGSRRIAVCSMCGLRQSGKSYLLNLLLERSQSRPPPTEGLWLCGVVSREDPESPVVVFLDCEGFGGKDSARDAQLMTLCSLLSSVLAINSQGDLCQDVLGTLAPALGFEENLEDRGNEASRPELLWILRDFVQRGQSTPDDALEDALHDSHAAGSNAAQKACKQLMGYFQRRSCVGLAAPADHPGHLRQLDVLPASSHFRAGVQDLRARLVASCLANPKAIGGQYLGCGAFVKLLQQLVASQNDGRILSLRGSWEGVQHTTCGALADELRGDASRILQALIAGETISGGAQLPLSEGALRTVLRDQRHLLKARWEEEAIGDEGVRKEYWRELKEALAKEEVLVSVQNARLADRQVREALGEWQAWLDAPEHETASAEAICKRLGEVLERTPAVPLSRAGRQAIDAAVQKVASARSAVQATRELHSDLHQQAVAWGEEAAVQEATARGSLESKHGEVAQARQEAEALEGRRLALQRDAEAQEAAGRDLRERLQAATGDFERMRLDQHKLEAEQNVQAGGVSHLRAELESARKDLARVEAERGAVEEHAKLDSETAAALLRRLEADIAAAKEKSRQLAEQLAEEQEALRQERAKTEDHHQAKVEAARREHEVECRKLASAHERGHEEHKRSFEGAHRQVQEQRASHGAALEGTRSRLHERERSIGVLEGKVAGLATERDAMRAREKELEERLRQAELRAAQEERERQEARSALKQVATALEKAHAEAAASERARQQELEAAEDRKVQSKGCGGLSLGRLLRRPRRAPAS